jgi:similar to stage IV sporulation protein
MLHPFRFIIGYKIIKIAKEYSAAFVNMCGEYGFQYTALAFSDEAIEVRASLYWASKITECARYKEIEISSIKEYGIWSIFKRYRKRYGLFIGTLLGIVFAVYSSFLVWDVRIEGNSRLSDGEVIDILKACGFGEGVTHRGYDTDVLENRVLIYSPDISWITVNIIGTVAEVEIRETEPRIQEEDMSAANLVAERAGVIEYFEDTRGNAAVEVGEAVSEGQLLVGGIYGSEEEGFRYTVAKGKVYASTEREFSVDVPLQYEKKCYTGRSKTEKYLIFFEKEVKIYRNSGNLYATCDTIEVVEYFHSFGGEELPFGIRTVRYLEYEMKPCERSIEEATELAYYELGVKTGAELPEAHLLSRRIAFEISDTEYKLRCYMKVIENIAMVSEIKVGDLLPKK